MEYRTSAFDPIKYAEPYFRVVFLLDAGVDAYLAFRRANSAVSVASIGREGSPFRFSRRVMILYLPLPI